MDPKTGKFHEVTEGGKLAETDEPVPDDWPVFTEGEMFTLKGHQFVLARINVSSLVLRPVTKLGKPARQTIRELTT